MLAEAITISPDWFTTHPKLTLGVIGSLWVLIIMVLLDTVASIRSGRKWAEMTASHLTPHVPSNLREFTAAFCPDQFRSTPGFPKPKIVANRMRLIHDEVNELVKAVAMNDIVEVADALTDIQYVVEGAFLAFGIDSDAVHRVVHETNMAKRQPDGTVKRDSGGKVLKPDNWQAPDIARVLREQRKLSLKVNRRLVRVVN